jgi:hypothetical protein
MHKILNYFATRSVTKLSWTFSIIGFFLFMPMRYCLDNFNKTQWRKTEQAKIDTKIFDIIGEGETSLIVCDKTNILKTGDEYRAHVIEYKYKKEPYEYRATINGATHRAIHDFYILDLDNPNYPHENSINYNYYASQDVFNLREWHDFTNADDILCKYILNGFQSNK